MADNTPIPNFLVMTPDEFVPLMVADQSGPLAQRFLTPPDMESEAGQTAVLQMTWSLACTAKFFWPIPDRGLDTRIHRITAPTLVVWGHRDNLVKSVNATSSPAGSAAPESKSSNAAHFPQIEQTERTPSLVGDFLAGASPPGPVVPRPSAA